MKTPLHIFIFLVLLSSCELGVYMPRTANVPQLDSVKKSDFTIGIGVHSFELQHNHLLTNRFLVQNNFANRPSHFGDASLMELGVGYYLDKYYTSCLIIGGGYSTQNFEYLLTDFYGTDGSYINVIIDQRNYFIQYSKKFQRLSVDNWNLSFHSKTDFNQPIDFYREKSNVAFYPKLLYVVQDLGIGIYSKKMRVQITTSLKFGMPVQNAEYFQNSSFIANPFLRSNLFTTLRIRL